MRYKKTCKECGKAISAKRSTKQFYNPNCQINHFQKLKRLNQKITKLRNAINNHKDEIAMSEASASMKRALSNLAKERLEKNKLEIANLEKELQKDYVTFQRDHTTIGKFAKDPNNKDLGWVGAGINLTAAIIAPQQVQQKRIDFQHKLYQKRQENISEERNILHYQLEIEKEQAKITQYKAEVRKLENSLAKLLKKLSQEDEAAVIETEVKKSLPRIGMDGVGAQDFLKQSFNTFRLSGNLGTFIGDIERNMLFITLIGDAGAGKSTLTMGIGQKFDAFGFKVIFFSLELGKSEPLQKMLRHYPPSNRFRIVCSEDDILKGKTPIEAIRESAKYYDVIMIDSFGKLNCKTEELDKLRNAFPETIFLLLRKTRMALLKVVLL